GTVLRAGAHFSVAAAYRTVRQHSDRYRPATAAVVGGHSKSSRPELRAQRHRDADRAVGPSGARSVEVDALPALESAVRCGISAARERTKLRTLAPPISRAPASTRPVVHRRSGDEDPDRDVVHVRVLPPPLERAAERVRRDLLRLLHVR